MHGFRHVTPGDDTVQVLVRGAVSTADVDRGRRSVAASIGRAADAARPQVKMADYPAGRAVAQINVHYASRLVRGQAPGRSVDEALRTACTALSRRLDRLERRLNEIPAGPPDFTDEAWDRRDIRNIPRQWRLAGPGRRIRRHKAVPLALQEAAAAALTMDLRDYDFHLFVEANIGDHALVHRAGPGSYRMRVPRPELLAGVDFGAPVTLDQTPLPRLSLPDAVRFLDRDEAPFVGFIAATTGRGTVLYRRYDGHLGVLTSLW
jgi:hypothetical protein